MMSSSLSELSHHTHNIMCYKINVIHTTKLNSKAKSKKREKETKLISIDQILLVKNFKSSSGVNQFYVCWQTIPYRRTLVTYTLLSYSGAAVSEHKSWCRTMRSVIVNRSNPRKIIIKFTRKLRLWQAGRRLVRSLLTICDINVSLHPWPMWIISK